MSGDATVFYFQNRVWEVQDAGVAAAGEQIIKGVGFLGRSEVSEEGEREGKRRGRECWMFA